MIHKAIPGDSIKRILILGSIGIGNLLLFSPCLRVIRKSFPGAHITLIVLKKGFVELYKDDPVIDDIIAADYNVQKTWWKRFQFIRDLRRGKYDLCITTFPANRLEYNLLPFLAGVRYRIAHRYDTKFWRTCSFLQNYRLPVDVSVHDLDQNINLLKPLGIDGEAVRKLSITLSDRNREEAAAFFQKCRISEDVLLIGLHAGSSVERDMHLKRWETEKFIHLCLELRRLHQAVFLIFGGPEERLIKHAVASGIGSECFPVEDVPLKTSAALIERCRLFISNDSGLMHVAAAVGVPCAAIFGPTDPGRTAPYGARHRIIRLGMHCSPCWSIHNVGAGRVRCIYEVNRCLKELSVKQVCDVVEDMLAEEVS